MKKLPAEGFLGHGKASGSGKDPNQNSMDEDWTFKTTRLLEGFVSDKSSTELSSQSNLKLEWDGTRIDKDSKDSTGLK